MAAMEDKQAQQRVLMQPYPRLVSWEQYKENVVSAEVRAFTILKSRC